MRHEEGKTQEHIASYFNISQGEVSRYLKSASEEHGIVHTYVDLSFNNELENNLKEKFKHLQKIIIVPHTHIAGDGVDPLLLRNLGTACAKYFLTGVHR